LVFRLTPVGVELLLFHCLSQKIACSIEKSMEEI